MAATSGVVVVWWKRSLHSAVLTYTFSFDSGMLSQLWQLSSPEFRHRSSLYFALAGASRYNQRLWPGQTMNRRLIPVDVRDFCFLESVWTSYTVHLACVRLVPLAETGRRVKLTTQHRLLSRQRMDGAILYIHYPLLLYGVPQFNQLMCTILFITHHFLVSAPTPFDVYWHHLQWAQSNCIFFFATHRMIIITY
jgi:hypothetical protein